VNFLDAGGRCAVLVWSLLDGGYLIHEMRFADNIEVRLRWKSWRTPTGQSNMEGAATFRAGWLYPNVGVSLLT